MYDVTNKTTVAQCPPLLFPGSYAIVSGACVDVYLKWNTAPWGHKRKSRDLLKQHPSDKQNASGLHVTERQRYSTCAQRHLCVLRQKQNMQRIRQQWLSERTYSLQ
ncbi:hypothetical protein CBL_08680 [Carabus blaptoides fortunei]